MKRATRFVTYVPLSNPISIHALMKRATKTDGYIKIVGEISIHALMKRATVDSVPLDSLISISIHALMKRATKQECRSKNYCTNFNPRSHEESDLTVRVPAIVSGLISIHALMKRATTILHNPLTPFPISIHALMKRATHRRSEKWLRIYNISIHALMKRATINAKRLEARRYYFNPRSHEESDIDPDTDSVRDVSFQSTLS